MKLFEVVDEFSNQEGNVNADQLFRVQNARCHELIHFLEELNRKFPSPSFFDDKNDMLSFLSYYHSSNLAPKSNARLVKGLFSFPTQKQLPPTKERYRLTSIFLSKYARMIKAKQAFEQTGRSYGEYRND